MTHARGPKRLGFTLVELLVVIAIIGLLISLVLVAASDGVRRAEERATQALITKLETGLNDRVDALLNTQAPVAQAHRYLAAINYLDPVSGHYVPVGALTTSRSDERRAQVMAQFDYLRAELPDVFFLNANTSNGATIAASYPLNFAAAPYPQGTTDLSNYVVPLGIGYIPSTAGVIPTSVPYTTQGGLYVGVGAGATLPYPAPSDINRLSVSGMFGASFAAAGGVYKNLYAAAASDMAAAGTGSVLNLPQGYDGSDNDGNGYIDDMGEIKTSPPGATSAFAAAVANRLSKHNHKTARAEMLYAVLIEGLSPLGSVFTRDEFTAREVQDTDGDGLPEFVDAWGEPLQFFRWPIYFGVQAAAGSSDSQKGSDPYNGYTETRQLDPLDPNQLLLSPGWWALIANPSLPAPTTNPFSAPGTGGTVTSQGATAFMNYFHLLIDPTPTPIPNPHPTYYAPGWDRSGSYSRRSYFSKFLILSAGSDKEPGVAQFTKDYVDLCGGSQNFLFPDPSHTIEFNAFKLIYIENQASQSDPTVRSGAFLELPDISTSPTTIFLQSNAGLDDISNHNIQAPSSGVR